MYISQQMATNIQENFKMTKCMGKVFLYGLTVTNKKEILKMEKEKEKELKHNLMEIFKKEII